jgi:YHS domain-containing protein
MKTFAAAALAFAAFALAPAAALAADPVFTGRFSNAAAGGYDVVAYFEEGKPVKGDEAFAFDWNGAQWRFASAERRDKFAASPETYAPQYGGYCAWAAAQGYLAPGNAQFWTVRDGKLYLNYDRKVQERWLADPDGFIAKANANWPGVLGK